MGNLNLQPLAYRAPRILFLIITTTILAFSIRENFTYKTISQRVTAYYFYKINITEIYNYTIGNNKLYFLVDSFPLNTYI